MSPLLCRIIKYYVALGKKKTIFVLIFMQKRLYVIIKIN
jgi:hypothetical protein